MDTNNTTTTPNTRTGSKAEMAAQVAQLQAQLEQALAANAAMAEQLAKASKPKGERTTLPTWNGHAATALVRNMALFGATPGCINRVLVHIGIVASPATITTQRTLAVKTRKAGAVLTAEQEAELRALMVGIPTKA